ncbi:MAG: M20/M25/M40 family metallo-hydrolase [Acidobacteria bacterium]|nr:MAG: M20/M25/M40 family metallo-hydrolase [Acidobacteriota bacterium]
MRKSRLSVLVPILLTFTLKAQAPASQQPKPEDVLKNLVQVEKTQTVPDKMKPGFESITARDAITMLTFISSDLMEGRETATRGFQLAAEYAESQFALWKLKPAGDVPVVTGRGFAMMSGPERRPESGAKSYHQEFAMLEVSETSSEINLDTRMGPNGKKRVFQPGMDFTGSLRGTESLEAPVVFAGYGITEKEVGYDDFKNLDVKGKIVLILSEAPGKNNPESPFQKDKELKEKYFQPAMPAFQRGGDSRFSKTREIAKLGVAAILVVNNSGNDSLTVNGMSAMSTRPVSDERPIIPGPRRRLSIPGAPPLMPGESAPVINITRDMANAILEPSGEKIDDLKKKIETSNKPASTEIAGSRLSIVSKAKSSLVRCRNVVGYVEGSDPKLKDEIVVIGAHMDHNGKRGDYIFNGADDNGSGSVGVMALARAFATNPEKPKRTVLFCLWTGEEQGLLGSRYYVMNPVFPIEKTVAYLNLDMISRPYDERTIARAGRMMGVPQSEELLKKIKPANFLPVSFSAGSGLGDVLKNADQSVGLDLFLREAGEGRGMGGSDHSSFGAVKVPWAFVITSMHDDYHQTSDSVEKVSGEMMEKISRLIYLTAYTLADK